MFINNYKKETYMSNFNCDDTFLTYKNALANVAISKNVHGSLFELVTESKTTSEFVNEHKAIDRLKLIEKMCNKIKNCKKMTKAQSFVENILVEPTNTTPETFSKLLKLYELCEDEDTEDTQDTEEELEPEIKEELDHYIKIYKVDGLSTYKILEGMIEFLKWLCVYGKNADRELAKQFKEELEDAWLPKFSELVNADPETGDEEPVEEPAEDDAEEPAEEPVEDDTEETAEEPAEEDAEETKED